MNDTKSSTPGGPRSQGAKTEAPKAGGKGLSTGADLQRLYLNAYQDYVRSCQSAWLETQRRYQEALFKYYQDVQSRVAPEDAFQRFSAQRDSLQSFQDAVNPQDLQKPYEEAYRNYLRAIQDAWSQLDVDSLELSRPLR